MTRIRLNPEDEFHRLLLHHGIPHNAIQRQYRFHPTRRWLADFALTQIRILAEIEGGVYMPGRKGHASIKGIERDIEKYNEAQLQGWIVLRTTTKHHNMDLLARRIANIWLWDKT